jgi:hypothetical protein
MAHQRATLGRVLPDRTARLPFLAGGLLLISALAPSTAEASIRLGFGTDYWFNRGGEFNFTVAPFASLVRGLEVGGRLGVLVATDPAIAGLPLDLQLRLSFEHAYFEGSAGPWILFVSDSPVRAHFSFGMGLQSHALAFGLEAGWLDPNAVLGLRLSFKL